MAIKQWVNLDKDQEYAKDSDIGSIDRCGRISLKITLENDKAPVDFKSKIIPDGKNVTYTSDEEGRNSKFKLIHTASGISSDKEYIMNETIQLPAAGGNKYKIEAKDSDGKTVSSVEVEAWRKLYYQVMCMDDGKNKVPASALGKMEAHAKKYFIALQQVGGITKIPYTKTIGMHGSGTIGNFGIEVTKAFSLNAAHKKVGIAAVFSEYISTMGSLELRKTFAIGSSDPKVVVTATDVTLIFDQFLWYGLDDADDAAKKWFISAMIGLEEPAAGSGPPAKSSYTVPSADVSITGTKLRTYGGYHQIKIARNATLDKLLNAKKGKLSFYAKVNVTQGWTNGFSWNPSGVSLITTARRVAWQDMPANTTEYTWNHEVGHRFGMVAYGNKKGIRGANKLPDGPSTLYGENRGVNDKSHAGPHCEKGATYNATSKQWSGTPGCVMFGANGIGAAHAPNDYCSECQPIVKKLDLS